MKAAAFYEFPIISTVLFDFKCPRLNTVGVFFDKLMRANIIKG